MKSRPRLLLVTLLAFVTFFSYGCTAAARKEIVEEALGNAKQLMADEGKKLLDKAEAAVDKKLEAAKAAKYAELDAQLAQLKLIDPETNEPVPDSVKTWKDFDANKDGVLDVSESAKAQGWITRTAADRVAAGKMSKEQAASITKNSVATLGVLLLLGLGKRGASKGIALIRGKPNGAPPGSSPPAAPAAPASPAAPAAPGATG